MRAPAVIRHIAIRRRRAISPLLMGTVGIVLVAVVLVVAVALPRGWYLVRTDGYTAEFANAAGLTVADPVYLAGVPAGRVESVDLSGDHVTVRFRLDKHQDLGAQTTASIKLKTILGKRYLEIIPAGSGLVGADDTIPLSRTSVPYSLDEISSKAQSAAQGLDIDAIKGMVQTLGQVLPADSDPVSAALTGVSSAAAALTRNGEQITQLLATSKSLSGLIAGQSGSLTTMLDNANIVLGTLSARRAALSQLVQDLRTLTAQAAKFLTDNGDELNQLLVNLHAVTDTLSKNAQNIDTLMTKLPPALRAVTDASGNGNWMDVSAPAGPISDNLLCELGIMKDCK
jgi:phospholipid/cholesterol/gamma-HCH transport system substrate-binding protein